MKGTSNKAFLPRRDNSGVSHHKTGGTSNNEVQLIDFVKGGYHLKIKGTFNQLRYIQPNTLT